MAIYRVKCKICGAISTIDTCKKTWDTVYSQAQSPYGGKFPHASILHCPLSKGLDVDELLQDKDVEVLK